MLKGIENLIGRKNIPNNIAEKQPIVHCKHAGDGRNTIKYLARYVFKTGISNNRIISLENGQVTFSYNKTVDKKREKDTMSLPVDEFISRFIQHILPRGFVRVRHYGFNHPNSKIDLDELRIKIMNFSDQLKWHIREEKLDKEDRIEINRPICSQCKIEMQMIEVIREVFSKYPKTG